MTLLLSVLLVFAIILKFFTPKEPNYFFGYQLGSAKKSTEHWKVANRYASTYMMVLYTATLLLSLLFGYQNYDGQIIILIVLLIGFILMYFDIEKRLKRVDKAGTDDSGFSL